MRAFQSRAFRPLTLTHGDEPYELKIYAPPVGYTQILDAEFGEPPSDEAGKGRRSLRSFFALVAKCLGEQLSASPPSPGSGASAWEAYADQVRDEMAEAGFTDEDLTIIGTAITSILKGEVASRPNV
jgi:hypothetical protein